MDRFVGDILRSVLGGRRKRANRAARFLTGGLARGVTRGVFANPSTLLGVAGVAWGIFETLQNRSTAPAPDASATGLTSANTVGTPPPLPGTPAVPPAVPPSEDTLRLVRLAVSAANADGEMNEKEKAAVIRQVTATGAAAVLERELARPWPLPDIIAGVSAETDKATLYVLAFTIVRADEQISGAERIYLAQLANLLGLEPKLVAALEKDTGERIDALGDQGQLGG